jgi:hydroxymethylpyrimidine pyrophosphatase-like HAD family hydrolase
MVASHLGFWTDNGAYYYYKTERGINYEDTLVIINEYFKNHNIPIQYFNFDSWWYLKHTNKAFTTIFRPIVRLMGGGLYGNTLRWETDPEKFSTDLKTFYENRFKTPITAHNRRWDSRSPYLDKYDFITYKTHACPLKKDFWEWLMHHAQESGIIVYEQDWMKNQIHSTHQLREDVTAVERWLHSMATAAKNNEVNVFYCMQTPALLLYSIKHPNITISRCSGDYNHRWPLTYRYVHSTQTNILINAVGLNSHPDVFRSRSMEESIIRPVGEKNPLFK